MPKLSDLPLQAAAKIQQYAERGSAELHYARKMLEAGAFKIEPPQHIAAPAATPIAPRPSTMTVS